MKLKGTVEIEESNYKKALELAFTDYLEDGAQTPEFFKEYMIDRLFEDFGLDITLDEETIAQAVDDTKRFIREVLKNI
jgi:hypothetical protein